MRWSTVAASWSSASCTSRARRSSTPSTTWCSSRRAASWPWPCRTTVRPAARHRGAAGAWRRASSTCGSTSASSSTTRGPTSSASCGRPAASGRPATRTRQRSAERRTSRLLARQRSAERRTSGLMSEVCTDYDDAGEAAQRRSSGSVSEVYPGAASRHSTLDTQSKVVSDNFKKTPDSTELDVFHHGMMKT